MRGENWKRQDPKKQCGSSDGELRQTLDILKVPISVCQPENESYIEIFVFYFLFVCITAGAVLFSFPLPRKESPAVQTLSCGRLRGAFF